MRKLRIPGFEPAEGGICPRCGLEMNKHNKLTIAEKGHDVACLLLLRALVAELTRVKDEAVADVEKLKRDLDALTTLNKKLVVDAMKPTPVIQAPSPFTWDFSLPKMEWREVIVPEEMSYGISWDNVIISSSRNG